MKTLEQILVGIGVCLSLAGCGSRAGSASEVESKPEVQVYKIPAPSVCKSDVHIGLVGYGGSYPGTSPVIYCKGTSGEELACDVNHYSKIYHCYQIDNSIDSP
jgi:hypothetical protein